VFLGLFERCHFTSYIVSHAEVGAYFKALYRNSDPGTEDSHEKLEAGQPIWRPRLEPETSWIRSRSANHYIVKFGPGSIQYPFDSRMRLIDKIPSRHRRIRTQAVHRCVSYFDSSVTVKFSIIGHKMDAFVFQMSSVW